ncbi:MAG: glycosyltransferase [Limnospira sp.]
MPLISIIIPVYNGEKTIRETIASVLNQTLTDFELLIIDDGSTDSTSAIASSFTDPRIKLLSYPNAGLAASRNRGIRESQAEYISFIDADDLWTPDKLESQYQALREHPEAALAYSWTDCIDESGNFFRRGSHFTVDGNVYSYILVNNFIESGSNILVHRRALLEVGLFDESLSGAADRDLWIRLAARYPFVAVPKVQILYRISPTSMSANIIRQAKESTGVIQRAYSQAPSSLQYLKKHSLANIYKYLTVKALEGEPDRGRAIFAAQLLYQAIVNEPSLLQHRVTVRALLKILAIAILPQSQARILLARYGRIDNIGALMMLIRTDPE